MSDSDQSETTTVIYKAPGKALWDLVRVQSRRCVTLSQAFQNLSRLVREAQKQKRA